MFVLIFILKFLFFTCVQGNSCNEIDQSGPSWNYELFSCTSCDKTSPNSCKESVRAITQMAFTGYAAAGFLIRAIADVYVQN